MLVIPATQEAEEGGIAWTQEAEVAVSRDRAIALQPEQQIKTVLKKKRVGTARASAKNLPAHPAARLIVKTIKKKFKRKKKKVFIKVKGS